jgi:transcriptional regulator with XRE-family HTH domain
MENNLEHVLRKKGMSQGELSRRTKMDRPYINRIVRNGVPNIRVETALRIARAIGVPVELIWSLD